MTGRLTLHDTNNDIESIWITETLVGAPGPNNMEEEQTLMSYIMQYITRLFSSIDCSALFASVPFLNICRQIDFWCSTLANLSVPRGGLGIDKGSLHGQKIGLKKWTEANRTEQLIDKDNLVEWDLQPTSEWEFVR